MKPVVAATPLFALDAVALDTETTGLDPATDRIVQLGMVNISARKVVESSKWQQVVNPGVAIPSRTTAIHGIDATMAASAPALNLAWPEFTRRLGSHVVVGHSIGFDLAVLKAEAQRHRLTFRQPRFLCVRVLATIVAPSLGDHSLDALADWLQVEVAERHQALADAEVAARIFCGLVPLLEEKGITTLAQAERASARSRTEVDRQTAAGWTPAIGDTPRAEKNPLDRTNTYAYRHTVADVMSSPVATVRSDMPLKAAMDVMVAKGFSSLFVSDAGEPGGGVEIYGIITERDVMRRISTQGAAALEMPVGVFSNKPLHTIRAKAFVYRAAGRMARLRLRHLGVRSEDGKLVGVVSARDLLRLSGGAAVVLDDSIEAASSAEQLAIAWASLPAMVESLLADDVDARTACAIVSEEIRSMTRRAAVLAQAQMAADDLGEPPCPFAILVLGSGGRGESMLVPDQDNAIVFAEGEPDGDNDRWFAELAARMAAILDRAGIPLCKGGVMARNPQWRGSLATWRARIADWVSRSNPNDLLNVDIFYDAATVHGELGLGQSLFEEAYAAGSANVAFAKALGQSVSTVQSPFGFFGALRGKDNRLDVKLHLLFPIAAFARTLAIRHNVARHSTRERLEGLMALDIGAEGDLSRMVDAHSTGLQLILRSQSKAVHEGRTPDNFLDLGTIESADKGALKAALHAVEVVPELVRTLMFARDRG